MLFATKPIVVAYHSSLAFLTERCSLLFRIDVAENCLYTLIVFFLSALLGGQDDVANDFDGVPAPAESVVFLPQPTGFNAFKPDVGLFSVFQSSQFDCTSTIVVPRSTLMAKRSSTVNNTIVSK